MSDMQERLKQLKMLQEKQKQMQDLNLNPSKVDAFRQGFMGKSNDELQNYDNNQEEQNNKKSLFSKLKGLMGK